MSHACDHWHCQRVPGSVFHRHVKVPGCQTQGTPQPVSADDKTSTTTKAGRSQPPLLLFSIHISVQIPHQDGMLPLVSTMPLHNLHFLLSESIYRQQHVCSNLVTLKDLQDLSGQFQCLPAVAPMVPPFDVLILSVVPQSRVSWMMCPMTASLWVRVMTALTSSTQTSGKPRPSSSTSTSTLRAAFGPLTPTMT